MDRKMWKIWSRRASFPVLFCLVIILFVSVDVYAEDSKLLWLVNPSHFLDPAYQPSRLDYVCGYPIHPEAGCAFLEMQKAMKAEGIKNIRLQSAYRPYKYQRALFNEKAGALRSMGYKESEARILAACSVAPPGASEHQLGLAVDVSVNGRLDAHFGSTEAGVWLQNNSDRYGFIVRYPKEKIEVTRIIYEPWHLRYVGLPHARYIREHNMCLEEYIRHVKEAGILVCWVDEGMYYKISFCDDEPETEGSMLYSSIGPGGDGFILWELREFLR